MDKDIKVTLKVWRQKGPKDKGQFETYQIDKINQSVSFLEMLDILNERLVSEGKEPIVFDHDCREGICGMCSLYVNGHPHGPVFLTLTEIVTLSFASAFVLSTDISEYWKFV